MTKCIETQTYPKYALLRAKLCGSHVCFESGSSWTKIDKKNLLPFVEIIWIYGYQFCSYVISSDSSLCSLSIAVHPMQITAIPTRYLQTLFVRSVIKKFQSGITEEKLEKNFFHSDFLSSVTISFPELIMSVWLTESKSKVKSRCLLSAETNSGK